MLHWLFQPVTGAFWRAIGAVLYWLFFTRPGLLSMGALVGGSVAYAIGKERGYKQGWEDRSKEP
jgi:hypothetical protein